MLSLKRIFRIYPQKTKAIIQNRLFSSSTSEDGTVYCRNVVRKCDWEGYICNLLLPKTCIDDVFALRAFNAELSQIDSLANNQLNAGIRYAFWKDSLDLIFKDDPPNTPIVTELFKAIKRHNLSRVWLTRMISARESTSQFGTVEDVEEYADHSSTAMICLTLQCLGINDIHSDHVASHIGKAQTITTLLRGIKYHQNRNKVLLPHDLLIKHNLSQEDVVRNKKTENLQNLAFDFASQANSHLQHARTIKVANKLSNKAFLIAASIDWYLKTLEKHNFDVYHPSLLHRNHMLPFDVFKLNWKKKF